MNMDEVSSSVVINDHYAYLWSAYIVTFLVLLVFGVLSLVRFYRARRLLDKYLERLSSEKITDSALPEKKSSH